MEVSTFGWCMLAACGFIISMSATLSADYIYEFKGKHLALFWLALNMAAVAIPGTLLVSLALVK